MFNSFDFPSYIAMVVVNESLDRGMEINTSKLMKLLYFMQKLYLQKFNSSMISLDFVTKDMGPFITEIWDEFDDYRFGFYKKFEIDYDITLSEQFKDVLNYILDTYGNLSAWDMALLSIKDEAYRMIWKNGDGDKEIIPQSLISTTPLVEVTALDQKIEMNAYKKIKNIFKKNRV